jgi:hypothetical protein
MNLAKYASSALIAAGAFLLLGGLWWIHPGLAVALAGAGLMALGMGLTRPRHPPYDDTYPRP